MIIIISKKKILIITFTVLFIILVFSIIKYNTTSTAFYYEESSDVLNEYIPTSKTISNNNEVREVLKDYFKKEVLLFYVKIKNC